jgi:type IV pilus assembly protein PilN
MMIRINLLRNKRSRRADVGHRQLLAMAASVVVTVGAIAVAHFQASSTLETVVQENTRLQAEIDALKKELGDYDRIKAQREELLKQRKSIEQLEAGRTGPVYLLRELSELLTPGKGPTFDRVTYEEALRRDPNVGFNASWETRRAWMDSYEEANKKVKIRGVAKSHDDAAEFMKRLNSSVFFKDVRLENTIQSTAALGSVPHITFNLNAEVIY